MAKKKESKRAQLSADEMTTYVCSTNPVLGESWKSKVNSTTVNDGSFHINPEGPFGYFDGLHYLTREPIHGCCLGSGFWFVRPTNDPRFLYKGRFVSASIVRGTRTAIPAFAAKTGDQPLADDPWEAEKTT